VEITDGEGTVWILLLPVDRTKDDDAVFYRAVRGHVGEYQRKTTVTLYTREYEETITLSLLRSWVQKGFRTLTLLDTSRVPFDEDTVLRTVKTIRTTGYKVKKK